jgi:hypothetical protein
MVYINFTDKDGKIIVDSLQYQFLVRSPRETKIVRRMTLDEIKDLVNDNTMKCSFYLYSLYDDETVKEDLSDYVLDGGSLTINYNNGVRRNLSISIFNEKKWISKRIWLSVRYLRIAFFKSFDTI